MVMHASVPELDGKKNLFVAINDVVKAGEHGFVTYQWHNPLTGGRIIRQPIRSSPTSSARNRYHLFDLEHAFQRKAIVEGVETPAHGTKLLQLGCEIVQGYGIARPMPADQTVDWVTAYRPDPSWVDHDAARDAGPLRGLEEAG